MKVSINSFKPAPFIGALITAGGNLLGDVISAGANAAEGQKQREHDKEMATLNQTYYEQNMATQQQYNEQNMAIQNQYQIDQWNRENAYNDPSAVAERYRKAGINPRAAFGSGSASGAGIAHSLSSAPSGGTPAGSGAMGSASNIRASYDFGGLGHAIMQGLAVGSQIKKTKAETLGQDLDNQIKEVEANYKDAELLAKLQNLRADTVEKLSKSKKNSAEFDVYVKSLAEIDARINKLNKDVEVADANIDKTRQDIKESDTRIDNINADTELKYELRNKETQLIDLLRSQKDLTEEQIRKIGADIAQGWTKLGIDGASKLNEIISTWVPSPANVIKKVTEVLHKSSKKK